MHGEEQIYSLQPAVMLKIFLRLLCIVACRLLSPPVMPVVLEVIFKDPQFDI